MNEEKILLQKEEAEENVLFGVIGAFLFSLVGGVLYYVLYQIGYLAAISGIVGVVCALKGYAFFAKKESKKGIVISIIMAALVLVIAWYFCLSNDVYLAYQEWYANGEVDFTLTFFESVSVAYMFLLDVPGYFADLGISLLLAGVGCAGYVTKVLKKNKAIAQQNEQQ